METTHSKAGVWIKGLYIKPVDLLWFGLWTQFWSERIISSFGLPADEDDYIQEALLGREGAASSNPL